MERLVNTLEHVELLHLQPTLDQRVNYTYTIVAPITNSNVTKLVPSLMRITNDYSVYAARAICQKGTHDDVCTNA
jgi:hypothetical protein